MKLLTFLILSTALFTGTARADFPPKLRCSDAFQSLTVDSNGFYALELRNGDYHLQLKRWEADVQILEKQVVQQVQPLEEVFSAKLRITRVDGQALGLVPLSLKVAENAIETRAICYQDLSVHP